MEAVHWSWNHNDCGYRSYGGFRGSSGGENWGKKNRFHGGSDTNESDYEVTEVVVLKNRMLQIW